MFKQRVTIIGGGVSGLCTAKALIKHGYSDVKIFEKASSFSKVPGANGALYFPPASIPHLDFLGIKGAVRAKSNPINLHQLKDARQVMASSPIDGGFAIKASEFLEIVGSTLPQNTLNFSSEVSHFNIPEEKDQDQGSLVDVLISHNGGYKSHHSRYLIAADGDAKVRAAIRAPAVAVTSGEFVTISGCSRYDATMEMPDVLTQCEEAGSRFLTVGLPGGQVFWSFRVRASMLSSNLPEGADFKDVVKKDQLKAITASLEKFPPHTKSMVENTFSLFPDGEKEKEKLLWIQELTTPKLDTSSFFARLGGAPGYSAALSTDTTAPSQVWFVGKAAHPTQMSEIYEPLLSLEDALTAASYLQTEDGEEYASARLSRCQDLLGHSQTQDNNSAKVGFKSVLRNMALGMMPHNPNDMLRENLTNPITIKTPKN